MSYATFQTCQLYSVLGMCVSFTFMTFLIVVYAIQLCIMLYV